MIALLDINVLIARADSSHVFHRRSVEWLKLHGSASVATCPLTENGFLRIYGNPTYPGGPGSLASANQLLAAIRRLPQHIFLPDDISINESRRILSLVGVGHQQLTDLYLLALAVNHSAIFATFDCHIDSARVVGGSDALVVIPS